jgi:hypothetical protein
MKKKRLTRTKRPNKESSAKIAIEVTKVKIFYNQSTILESISPTFYKRIYANMLAPIKSLLQLQLYCKHKKALRETFVRKSRA